MIKSKFTPPEVTWSECNNNSITNTGPSSLVQYDIALVYTLRLCFLGARYACNERASHKNMHSLDASYDDAPGGGGSSICVLFCEMWTTEPRAFLFERTNTDAFKSSVLASLESFFVSADESAETTKDVCWCWSRPTACWTPSLWLFLAFHDLVSEVPGRSSLASLPSCCVSSNREDLDCEVVKRMRKEEWMFQKRTKSYINQRVEEDVKFLKERNVDRRSSHEAKGSLGPHWDWLLCVILYLIVWFK